MATQVSSRRMPHRKSVPAFEVITSAPSTDIGPRDCVREFPVTNPENVKLVAFDWSGRARYESEVPLVEDLESWSEFLLKRCRRHFPAPRSHLELLG